MPDGNLFELRFVADENGFQPDSQFLPVAPEFPHPIPDFVIAQIEKARLEDEAAERETTSTNRGPSSVFSSYNVPAPAPSRQVTSTSSNAHRYQ